MANPNDPDVQRAYPESSATALETLHGKDAYDDAGKHWLAGNLVSDSQRAKSTDDKKIEVTPEELVLGRQVQERLVAILNENSHHIKDQYHTNGYSVQINKSSEGIVSFSFTDLKDDSLANLVTGMIRGAASALHLGNYKIDNSYYMGTDFNNITELARVVNAISPPDKQILLPRESAVQWSGAGGKLGKPTQR